MLCCVARCQALNFLDFKPFYSCPMRFIFLIGGFVCFLLVSVTGLLADRNIDLVLRDASIAALAGGFLFRWFWAIFVKLLSQAVRAKRVTRQAGEDAAAAAAKAAANAAIKQR
jgi:hypothetical protein